MAPEQTPAIAPTLEVSQDEDAAPSEMRIVPLRHYGRWAAGFLVLLFAAWSIRVLVGSPAFDWPVVRKYLFDPSVLRGVKTTIWLTALSFTIGVITGTLIAIMRLSPNPVLRTVAAFYQWLFRGVPTLIQLFFWFNLAVIFPTLQIKIGSWMPLNANTNHVMTPLLAAAVGLGLNLAAYYSEIVRAGILSVDEGQTDAAAAYGLRRTQTMRHIVLPQAMRVIIPPTGNELIGMLKYTSLASVIGLSELTQSVENIYERTFQIVPLLVVATIWYLVMTSVLSIGQYFVERHFSRGTRRQTRSSWLGSFLRNAFWRPARDEIPVRRSFR
jgi:polar amino acid transport system permease protein